MSQQLLDKRLTLEKETSVLLPYIGTAVPEKKVSQAEILDFFMDMPSLKESTKSLYGRVLRHPSINHRYFALDHLDDVLEADPGEINRRFEVEARRLATQALERALLKNGIQPASIDVLITTTCTGYLCPGLSSHLLESVPLKGGTKVFDLVGMGCGAALPALQLADSLVSDRRGSVAAVVCSEVCSSAFFSDDSPEAVISNSIFSDGAAAILVSKRDAAPLIGHTSSPSVALMDYQSLTEPLWRNELRFKNVQGFLKNILGAHVPAQAAALTKKTVARVCDRWGLSIDDIDFWAIHPGGDKVITALQRELNISVDKLEPARWVLKNYGNMSSASILFVLERSLPLINQSRQQWGLVLSFGAGFSVHAVLVRTQL